MADTVLQDLPEVTTPASDDLLYLTSTASSNESSKIQVQNLVTGPATIPVTVSEGGTSLTTLTASRFLVGAGTSAVDLTKVVPTGTVVGTSDAQTLTNKTLTAPIIATISNSGTLTLPTSTDTLVGRATTDTLTNKTLTAPVLSGTVTGTYTLGGTPTFPSTVVTTTGTQTLTNKRNTRRTGTVVSAAQPTINSDNVDFFSITAQTEAITSMSANLSGTPTTAQTLWIAITGTAARAITWGASFESSTVTLPTTTVSTSRIDILVVWTGSIWRCVAVA